MIYLYSLAGVGLIVSTVFSRKKTVKALKTSVKMFLKMLPMLLGIVAMVSVLLYFIPGEVIADYLGGSDVLLGTIIGALIGTISLLPGFITFPLCGLLLDLGVSYTVLAAFTTTLMMVGVITYPLEKSYFGTKLAILRNLSAFIIATIISLVIGIVYGEVL